MSISGHSNCGSAGRVVRGQGYMVQRREPGAGRVLGLSGLGQALSSIVRRVQRVRLMKWKRFRPTW